MTKSLPRFWICSPQCNTKGGENAANPSPALNSQRRQVYAENDQRPTRDSMSIEETTISNMWEIAVIVEVLEAQPTRC